MTARSFARAVLVFASLAAVFTVGACGSDDSTGPGMADVAGSYDATTFTVTTGGTDYDMLESGSSIHLVLSADGTTSGRAIVPAGDVVPEALDEDLVGTWLLSGSTVTFSHEADSFIGNVPFTVDGNELVGNGSFGAADIHLVMTRQ